MLPDPFTLVDMEAAALRIADAVERGHSHRMPAEKSSTKAVAAMAVKMAAYTAVSVALAAGLVATAVVMKPTPSG